MEYLFIYLLQITENLGLVIAAAASTAIVSGFFWGIMALDNASGYEHDAVSVKKTCIWSIVITVVCLCIPSKQTLLLMGGTYLGKKAVAQVVQSEKLQKVSEIIDLKLDKLIKENQ